MVKCDNCDNGVKHHSIGDKYSPDKCPQCDGTGMTTLVNWTLFNGWQDNGIGGSEMECSNGFYELTEDNRLYFIDRDFERFKLAKIKSIDQLLTHIQSNNDN